MTAASTTLDLELPKYNLVNLSAGMDFERGFSAILYVNNVTDEKALLSFDRERGGRARLGFATNQPRTIGVTLRWSTLRGDPAETLVAFAATPDADLLAAGRQGHRLRELVFVGRDEPGVHRGRRISTARRAGGHREGRSAARVEVAAGRILSATSCAEHSGYALRTRGGGPETRHGAGERRSG